MDCSEIIAVRLTVSTFPKLAYDLMARSMVRWMVVRVILWVGIIGLMDD